MQTKPSILQKLTGATNERDARFRFFILITGSLVILAMTYGSGMRSQKNVLERRGEEVKNYKRDLRLTQMELREKDAHVQQLEARRKIALAQAALQSGDMRAGRLALSDAARRLRTAEEAEIATHALYTRVGEERQLLAQKVKQYNDAKGNVTSSQDADVLSPFESIANRLETLAADGNDNFADVNAIATDLDALLAEIAPKPDALTEVTVPAPTLNDVPQTPAVPGGEVLRR